MIFEPSYIYHIYNQGNNRQHIFFKKENYQFFLSKIELYINPYADILAYCLMPNHFHLMVLVNRLTIDIKANTHTSRSFTSSETLRSPHKNLNISDESPEPQMKRTLNDSIGIMLRSYTRAINKQENFSGALFRKETKAKCLNCPKGLTPSFYLIQGIVKLNSDIPEKQYPNVCFNYIHQNPVRAGLVKLESDWEFSSAATYIKQIENKMISKNISKEYGLF